MRPSSHRMSWPARLGLCVVLIALLSAFLPASPFSTSVPPRARAATRAAVTLFPPETLYANGASLNWTKYSGPPQFDRYEVHRSPTPGFTPSQTTLIATLGAVSQTTYRDPTAAPAQNFTYKIAVAGTASSEQTVTLPAAGTATKTIQPDPASGQNTYVENLTGVSACFNFGAKPSMLVGSDATNVYRGLLSFDLRDIPGSATVNSATLSLRHDAITTGGTVNVYPATRGWNEGSGLGSCTGNGATWSEATGGIAWTAAGGDYTTARVASVTHTSGQGAGWDNLDVRLHVQDWVSGGRPNRGLLLRHANESLGSGKTATYKSDDFTTTTTYRPKLTVTYTDDSASASPAVCMASLP